MFKKDLNAIKFLEIIKSIQINWVWEGTNEALCADPKKKVRHNVSNTVHVHPEEWGDVSDFIYDNRDYFTGVSLLSATGEKDYHQAPYQEVKSETELAKMYGPAALFASGLIVDSTNGFDNLWQACDVAMNPNADKSNQETKDTRSDWIRRFNKFAVNHFDGDLKKTSYCLKDVYLLWKWQKIQLNFVDPHLEDRLKIAKSTDIDTMGAVACSAGGCEI
jgi:ribonucleoside-triphosphate reductase